MNNTRRKQQQQQRLPGRPTSVPTGEGGKCRCVYLGDADWQKCLALGGSVWVRKTIRAAKL